MEHQGLIITVLCGSHKKGEDVVSDHTPKPPVQAGLKMNTRKREDVDSDKQKASGLFHPEVSVINTPYPRSALPCP